VRALLNTAACVLNYRWDEMELVKIGNPKEFRTYVATQRDQGLSMYLVPLRPHQHLYYIYNDQNRIGFVDLHYQPGGDDSLVSFYYLENRFRYKFKTSELLDIFAEKARILGSRTLLLEFSGEPDELRQAGWDVLKVRYLLQKNL